MPIVKAFVNQCFRFLLIEILFFGRAFLGPRGGCKFYPSCTDFAAEQLLNNNLFKAAIAIIKRLLTCHQFKLF